MNRKFGIFIISTLLINVLLSVYCFADNKSTTLFEESSSYEYKRSEHIYRWIDPETGKQKSTIELPPYPSVKKNNVGTLPNGKLIDVIIDENDPKVKSIISKRKEKEAAIRYANEVVRKAKETAEREEAARLAEEKRRIAEEQKIIDEDNRRIAEENIKLKKVQEEKELLLARERIRKMEEKDLAEEVRRKQDAEKIANRYLLLREKFNQISQRENTHKDIAFMLGLLDEFREHDKIASMTPKITLSSPLINLVNIKLRLDKYKASKCYAPSKDNLKTWMDYKINLYYAFIESKSSEEEKLIMEQINDQTDKSFEAFVLKFPESCNESWW